MDTTCRLPVELQCAILYRYGGLEHKTAKIIKDAMSEINRRGLNDDELDLLYETLCMVYPSEDFDLPLPYFDVDQVYEGGITYREYYHSWIFFSDVSVIRRQDQGKQWIDDNGRWVIY